MGVHARRPLAADRVPWSNGAMATARKPAPARFWIKLEPDLSIGPGKAELLEGIRAKGSIAAAGRRMGMSYKRAWTLIGEMNSGFKAPLVAAAKGGDKGGGARLTSTGAAVLRHYRRMEQRATKAAAADAAAIRRLMAKRRLKPRSVP